MKNYIVCLMVTKAARQVIEANGGRIETLREEQPHLELITVSTKQQRWIDTEFIIELGGGSEGIWYGDEFECLRIVYRWATGSAGEPESWGKNANDKN